MSSLPSGPVRVRFAPSPTGYLHLGSARTALFNWLWVRHLQRNGCDNLLLRIEDTDRERSQPELIDVIFDVLGWLGIDHDGEPTYQTDNAAAHTEAVDRLLAAAAAYRCDCSQDAVVVRNEAAGGPPGYDGYCRDRSVDASAPHVVRFRVPDDGATSWVDMVRGEISFEHANLEDFVLVRSDGTPVFIVADTVDDALGITHVIRGEDLINVTPKMLLVRRALGHDEPIEFGHLPLIVNEQRKKLSKRRDDVSVDSYRQRGILPSAMVNYLALLGWGPPDGVEVRPLEEIIELFDISDVNPSPAMFDIKKLEAVDGEHIHALPVDEDFIAAGLAVRRGRSGVVREGELRCRGVGALAPELQTRVRVLSEVPDHVDFLFLDEPRVDDASWAKAVTGNADALVVLDAVIDELGEISWDAESIHTTVGGLAEAMGFDCGKFQAPAGVAVTGRTVGPPLFESLALLGRDRTLDRLRRARSEC